MAAWDFDKAAGEYQGEGAPPPQDENAKLNAATANIAGTYGVSPQDGAVGLQQGPQAGLPPGVAMRTPEDVQAQARAQANAQTLAQSVPVRDFVASADPAHVAVAKADLPGLASVARAVDFWINPAGRFQSAGAPLSFHSLMQSLGEFNTAVGAFAPFAPGVAGAGPIAGGAQENLAQAYGTAMAAIPGPIRSVPLFPWERPRVLTTPEEKRQEFANQFNVATLALGGEASAEGVGSPFAGEAGGSARAGPAAPPPLTGGVGPFTSAAEAAQWIHTQRPAGASVGDFEVRNVGDEFTVHPVVRAGTPAPGVDQQVDLLRQSVAEADAQAVRAQQEAVAQNATHNLSPTTMEAFLASMTDHTVSVDTDALMKLAADGHTPFPGSEADILAAHNAGEDFEVPYSRYLSATAGQPFADELNASTVFRDGGVSVEEAKGGVGAQSAPELPEAKVEPPADLTPEEDARARTIAAANERATAEVFRAQYIEPLFANAKALDLTKPQYERLSIALEELAQETADRALERAYSQVLRERRPDFTALRDQHAATITDAMNSRRDVAAYRQLSTKGFKLDRDLTTNFFPEPASRLPSGMLKRGGNHPDDAADLVGYSSGAEMVGELAALHDEVVRSEAKGIDAYVRSVARREGANAAARDLGFDLSPESLMEEANTIVPQQKLEALLIDDLRAFAGEHGLPLDVEGMKANARTLFEALPVRDALNVRKLERAVHSNGRKAFGAQQKGDIVRAFRAKQLQFQRRLMLMEGFKFQKVYRTAMRQFNRLARAESVKTIDQDYLDRIHGVLAAHGFEVPQGNLKADYAEWAARQAAAGEPVLPYTGIPASTPPNDLTVEQFNDLADRVANLRHLGQEEKQVWVAGQKRELEEMVAGAVEGAKSVARQKPNTSAVPSKNIISSINSSMNSPEVMIDTLDGGNPNGVFNRVLMRGARYAAGADHTIIGAEMREIADLMNDIKADDWSRMLQRVPEGHGLMDPARPEYEMALLHQDLIGLALNEGSEEGAWHLGEGGNQWKPLDRARLLERLTPRDWEIVSQIQDVLERAWPKVRDHERENYGVAPEPVTAVPVYSPDGTLFNKGGYFPLARDEFRASLIQGGPKMTFDELFEHYQREAATPAGHTKKRTWTKYPVSLDWQRTLAQHLANVSKRLSYSQWVWSANRFLRQPEVRRLVADVHGPNGMRELQSWIHRQVGYNPMDPRIGAGVGQIARQLRLRTYTVMTGFKLAIAAEHLTSVAQTAAVAGLGAPVRAYTRALVKLLTDPGGMTKFVEDASPYMLARHDATSRELRDTLDEIRSGRQVLPFKLPLGADAYVERLRRGTVDVVDRLAANFFNWINHNTVAVPTWYGAYEDAVAGRAYLLGKRLDAMSHEDAVAYADKVIGKSHGSGLELDMGSFQSGGGNEWLKLANMYNIFHGVVGHIGREGLWHAIRGTTKLERLSGLYAMLMGLGGTMMVGKLVSGQGPKKDEEIPGWAFESIMDGLAHMIPFGSNIYRVGENFAEGRQLDFEVSPAEGAIKTSLKGVRDLGQLATKHRTSDKRFIQDVSIMLGFLLDAPTAQPGQTAQAMYDFKAHPGSVTSPVSALVLGPSHERDNANRGGGGGSAYH